MLLRNINKCACKLLRNQQGINFTLRSSSTSASLTDLRHESLKPVLPKELEASVLNPPTEDLSHIAPFLKPTFNFAAYVNNSETLQELLKLGVNLHKLEKKENVPNFILGLDFESQIKPLVMFLHEQGLNVEKIGQIITRNPFILKESIDDLIVRINYLLSKKFSEEMIIKILEKNPLWLSFTTRDIDQRLGFFQKTFSLTGNEVRALTVKLPQIITHDLKRIQENLFVIKEEMGLTLLELKTVLLNKPRVYMQARHKLTSTFDYLHNKMEIPLEMITKMPEILTCRCFRLQQRHLYLKSLDKMQLNPKKPGYLSPTDIVSGTDAEFAVNVAKTSIQSYNDFLKSL